MREREKSSKINKDELKSLKKEEKEKKCDQKHCEQFKDIAEN